jgi:molybdenum cofactor biosynthesis protein B
MTPGGRIDAARNFTPLAIAVLTVSDSRDAASDTSGDLLAARLAAAGHTLAARALVGGDATAIERQLRRWIDDPAIDAIIANGGTGLGARDVTPEAVRALLDRELDGFNVLWHLISYETVGVSTLQSRACAGLARGTVIYALPGSNGACADGWDRLIAPQLDSRHRPCSIVEALARFQRGPR